MSCTSNSQWPDAVAQPHYLEMPALPQGEAGLPAWEVELSQAYRAPNRTILCIDDDEGILRYERALLERSGYAVLTASSAQRGLELATMRTCDAVLLDYRMPGMDGHRLAFEIKRTKPELTVIFVSGSDVPMQTLDLVDAFVPKLEASQQLLPVLAELLQTDSRRAQVRGSSA